MMHLSANDLVGLLADYGYWAVLFVVAVESMGLPVPGETTLLVASIYAGTTHRLSIWLVVAAAAAGAVIGDNVGFLLGREGGHRIVHRFGKYVGLTSRRMRLGEVLFERHGGKAVFFAGMHGMEWKRFLVFNAAGGLVWASVMGLGSFTLGAVAIHIGGVVGMVAGAVMLLITAAALVAVHRSEGRLATETGPAPQRAQARDPALYSCPH